MKAITKQAFDALGGKSRLYLVYTLLCKLLPDEKEAPAPEKKTASGKGGK